MQPNSCLVWFRTQPLQKSPPEYGAVNGGMQNFRIKQRKIFSRTGMLLFGSTSTICSVICPIGGKLPTRSNSILQLTQASPQANRQLPPQLQSPPAHWCCLRAEVRFRALNSRRRLCRTYRKLCPASALLNKRVAKGGIKSKGPSQEKPRVAPVNVRPFACWVVLVLLAKALSVLGGINEAFYPIYPALEMQDLAMIMKMVHIVFD